MKNISIILIVFIVLIACQSKLYTPVVGNTYKNTNYEELSEGRTIYTTQCSGCHQLYFPNQYDSIAWKKNIDEMKERAKISDKQADLVYKYVINFPK